MNCTVSTLYPSVACRYASRLLRARKEHRLIGVEVLGRQRPRVRSHLWPRQRRRARAIRERVQWAAVRLEQRPSVDPDEAVAGARHVEARQAREMAEPGHAEARRADVGSRRGWWLRVRLGRLRRVAVLCFVARRRWRRRLTLRLGRRSIPRRPRALRRRRRRRLLSRQRGGEATLASLRRRGLRLAGRLRWLVASRLLLRRRLLPRKRLLLGRLR